MSRVPLRSALVAAVLAALTPACVGRVVAVPMDVDHPANPRAAAGPSLPLRPEFVVEAPASGAPTPAGGGHGDHGGHGGHGAPDPAEPRRGGSHDHGGGHDHGGRHEESGK